VNIKHVDLAGNHFTKLNPCLSRQLTKGSSFFSSSPTPTTKPKLSFKLTGSNQLLLLAGKLLKCDCEEISKSLCYVEMEGECETEVEGGNERSSLKALAFICPVNKTEVEAYCRDEDEDFDCDVVSYDDGEKDVLRRGPKLNHRKGSSTKMVEKGGDLGNAGITVTLDDMIFSIVFVIHARHSRRLSRYESIITPCLLLLSLGFMEVLIKIGIVIMHVVVFVALVKFIGNLL
jgi:hypothetical protein